MILLETNQCLHVHPYQSAHDRVLHKTTVVMLVNIVLKYFSLLLLGIIKYTIFTNQAEFIESFGIQCI